MVESDYLDPDECQVYPRTKYSPFSIKLPPIHLFCKVTNNFRRYNCKERLDQYNNYLENLPLGRYMKSVLAWISVERDLIRGIEDLLGEEDYYNESRKMKALIRINLDSELYQGLIQEAKRIKKSCMIIDYEM